MVIGWGFLCAKEALRPKDERQGAGNKQFIYITHDMDGWMEHQKGGTTDEERDKEGRKNKG
jgi:hypothetical protein